MPTTKFAARSGVWPTWVTMASVLFAAGSAASARARSSCDTAILVLDASGSMTAVTPDGRTRIEIARKAVRDVVPGLAAGRDLGLILYGVPKGGQLAGDPICSARIKLEVPPQSAAAGLIIDAINRIEPGGATPLTEAVRLAVTAKELTAPPSTIVLVTDGLENCGRSPCDLGKRFAMKYPGLSVHVIGFFIDVAADAELACLTTATGGSLRQVDSASELGEALTETLRCPAVSNLTDPPPAAAKLT